MILTDTEGGFTFTLNSQEILMGRHISADLRFPDLSVSRYHALFKSGGRRLDADRFGIKIRNLC